MMERTVLVSLDRFDEAKEFWLRHLGNGLQKVDMHADLPGAKRFEEGVLPVGFPRRECDELRRMSRGNPLSLYILLLTALDIVLYKYTMQPDILVASPVYNVNPQEYNDWVAFRTHIEGAQSFKDLLLSVKQTVVEGYKHQFYPFPKLVDLLGLTDDSSLTRVLFGMDTIHDSAIMQKLLRRMEPDVYLALTGAGDEIDGELRYNKNKFSEPAMVAFGKRLILAVSQALENTSTGVKDILLDSGAQREAMLQCMNGPRRQYRTDATIPGLFLQQVLQTPGAPALRAASDLSDVFESLSVASPDREISWDIMGNCCFQMNPYLLARDVVFSEDGCGYKIIKTRQHNSVVVDDNLFALLKLFDGKRTAGDVLRLLGRARVPLLLYSVNADDVMEIGNRFGKKEVFHVDGAEETLGFIIKRLFQEKLLELVDIREESGFGNETLDPGYFPLQSSHSHRDQLDLILSRDKTPRQADVLIFGDTPGLSSTGLLYLASYLVRNGVSAYCQFSDTNWERQSLRENIHRLLAIVKPKIVAVSMKWFLHIARTLETCRIVKEYSPDTKVVLGGNSASYYWQEVIQYDFIDYVVRGDGELPLLEICKGKKNIPNCVAKEDGRIIESPMTYVHDADNSREIYLSHLDEIMLSTYAPFFGIFFIYTQRGCLLNCIYCGGCNRAMRKTFNRKNLFVRDPGEVRKDILAAIPFTSTLKFLFDDFDNERLLRYCKDIWEGIDLKNHFLFITNVVPPTEELVDYVNGVFKYVYWNVDLCSLSQRHRKELQKLGLAKPQPTDDELLAFLDKCEKYENNELIINLIVGLPHFNYDDIEQSKRMMDRIMGNYSSFSELFWARLHAQPGAPIIDNAGDYGMYSLASTFQDFYEISRRNFEDNEVYPGVDNFYYPYIYFKDDRLNSKLSQYYAETNSKIIHFRQEKRRKLMVYKDWSYEQLNRQADAVAAQLIAIGAQPGLIVPILAGRSLEMVSGMIGVMKAGCAYLPIDPSYPAARISYMVNDSGARQVLAQAHLKERIQFGGTILELKCDAIEQEENRLSDRALPDGAAYVIYTSGSTGLPKGVLVEHRSIVNTLQWRKHRYEFTADDCVLQIPSFSFDSSVEDIFTPLISGARLLLIQEQSRFNLPYLSDLIRKNRVSHFLIVPNFYRTFLQEIPESLKGMRTVTVAGENFTPDLVASHRRICPGTALFNEYGPTENSVCSTVYEFEPEGLDVWIGKPIDNVACYVMDRDLSLSPAGVPGELCVAGIGLARGYMNRVELTHEKFVDDPIVTGTGMYRTGDRCRLLENGNIEFLGRVDHQVKIRGFRIEPGEIESRLLSMAAIKEAVVAVGKKKVAEDREENFLCAYLVASLALDTAQLREDLSRELPEYMVPSYFIQLEKIPLTPNGKIDRNALPSPDSIGNTDSVTMPRTPLEKRLAVLWSDILSRDIGTIGVTDTFFELGGHSLNATVAVSRLHKEFNIRIPLAEFFSISTIDALAEHIGRSAKDWFAAVEPAETMDYYPLSAAQKRLFVLQQLEQGSTGYNMPMVIQLKGTIDSLRLEDLFNRLAMRHESLRTSFIVVDAEPAQRVHRQAVIKIEQLSPTDADGILPAVRAFIRPFLLDRPPLLRVGLIRREPGVHILLVDLHHIVSDGVSQGVLQEEFAALYSGEELEPLRIHYKDYSQWQHHHRQKQRIATQERYWVEKFSGDLPVLQLPTDYVRPAFQNFEGGARRFQLPAPVTTRLKEMAIQADATMYMAVLAIFVVWLAKISGQEDIIVGTPVAGRRHADLERVVGMFVNTLALRQPVPPDRSFKELLSSIKTGALEAFENQDFQFEDLVEHPSLHITRDLSRNPLFDAMFVFQNMEMPIIELQELVIEPFQFENSTSKFDLTLQAYEENDVLYMALEYSAKLFKEETIQRFALYLSGLAANLAERPSTPLGDISLMPESEMALILNEFNGTAREFAIDITVPQLVEDGALRQPEKNVLVWNTGSTTYERLSRRVANIAAGLVEKGVGPGTIVPVLHRRSPDLVAALLGILRAGAAYLSIDWEAPLERMEFILKDSGARLLLLDPGFERELRFDGLRVSIDELEENSLRDRPLPRYPEAGDVFYILYTSGSTGIPKGVMAEYRGVMNLLYAMAYRCPMGENGTYLFKTNYTFDVSVAEMFSWIVDSGRLAMLPFGEEKDPGAIAEAIQRFAVTHASFVPSMLHVFLETLTTEDFKKIQGLRYLMVGGEAVTIALAEKVTGAGLDAKIENLYGPTETTVYTTKYTIEAGGWERSVSIGKPLDNVRIYVMDPKNPLHMQPVGIAGELYIGGFGVSRGYLNRPSLTAQRYVELPQFKGERFYRSGDLGRYLPDGNLEYQGRMDQQVKVRGYRIELGEIENNLLEHGEIKEAAVIIKRDASGDAFLAAYVVPETGSERHGMFQEIVKDFLSRKLPAYMIPSYVVELEVMPLNRNGKVDRLSLPEPELPQAGRYIAPRNELEVKLAAVWSGVLHTGDSPISADANFFDLGGNSLKATMMLARAHREFGVTIPLFTVFEKPTIQELAERIGAETKVRYPEVASVEKRDYYPMSPAQNRLYFLQQMDQKSTVYNLPSAVQLIGEHDMERLEQALGELVRRHESFRTVFGMFDRQPYQRVLEEVVLQVERIDGSRPEDEPARIISNFVRPFDLGRAPLLRVAMLRLPGGRSILLSDMHHIISDGVSIQILIRDLTALLRGKTLEPQRVHYKDFAVWWRRRESSGYLRELESFWLGQFGGEIPVLNLPVDSPRPPVQSFSGGIASFTLEAETVARLRALASACNATLYMVLMAMFFTWLSKLSGQEDIVAGTPVAGRRLAELEDIIGMFVNTLAVRTVVDPQVGFDHFVETTRDRMLQAFEHQDFPFEDLVEKAAIKRDPARNPIFDVLFVLQNMDRQDLTAQDAVLRPVEQDLKVENPVARFDITMSCAENDGSLGFTLEYNDRLFSRRSIDRFCEYFTLIVARVAEDPSRQIREISILSDREKELILNGFNNTATGYPRSATVLQLFAQQADCTPDRVAVIDGDRMITYRELDSVARRVAAFLMENGVVREQPVAIMMKRCLEMIVGVLGILGAGGAYVPLNAEYPEQRKQLMLVDCGARWLLVDRPVSEHMDCTIIEIGSILASHDRPAVETPDGSAGHLCYIMYTSGTTGVPKGVMVEHRNVVRLVKETNYFDFSVAGRILQTGALEFDASTFEIWGALLNGLALVLTATDNIIDAAALKKTLLVFDIGAIWLTAPLFNQLLDADITLFEPLRFLLCGGDVLSPGHINRLRRRYPHLTVINGYGPTENTTFSTYFHVKSEFRGTIPIGRPIANSTVYIVDRFDRLQPAGIPGEVLVGGDGVARGYLGDQERTCEKFLDDLFKPTGRLYRTGDLGRWLFDGAIEFLGRIDGQVKIRGYRVELAEIESRLMEFPEIRDAVAIARDDPSGMKYLVAYLAAADGEKLDIKELREYLSLFLPGHMIPAYFMQLDSIPLNANGKVDRSRLPQPTAGTDAVFEKPSTPTEEALAAIWMDILGMEPGTVGVTADFFELGGHSLKATVLAAMVHREFDVVLPLVEIFKTPTLRDLALFIDRAVRDSFSTIEPVEKRDYYPASSAQKRMVILQQMDPASTVYNIPMVFPIDLNGGVGRLEDVFLRLIDRHEALRTSFAYVDDEPVQRVSDHVAVSLEQNPPDAFRRFIRPFDLSIAPLIRLALAEIPGGGHYLLFDIHHSVGDGVSMNILIDDFSRFYRGDDLLPLRIQYRDYAVWQDRQRESGFLERQRRFWSQRLWGELPVLDLPVDFPRPPIQDVSGKLAFFTIPASETAALKQMAQASRSTLFFVVLTLFYTWLSKITGNDDVIVGTPVAGRRHADLKDIAGMFVNTLALRHTVDLSSPLRDSVAVIRNQVLPAFENQDVPFEELLQTLKIKRDPARNPLFDVMFAFQNQAIGDAPAAFGRDESYPDRPALENPVSRFDLTVSFTENGDVLDFTVEYCTGLFFPDTVARLNGFFKHLVSCATREPELPLKELSLLDDSARAAILDTFNDTASAYPREKMAHEIFDEQVRVTPDKIAVINDDRFLTYEGLARRSDALARKLQRLGAMPEEPVGIMLGRTPDTIVAVLGILKAGCAYVPVNADYPLERKQYVLADCWAHWLISDGGGVAGADCAVIDPSFMEDEIDCQERFAAITGKPRMLCYVIYTSGSTGRPKGVMVEHRGVVRLVKETNFIDFSVAGRILQTGALEFDASTFEIWGALLNGLTLALTATGNIIDGGALKKILLKHDIDTIWLTAPLFNQLLDADIAIFKSLRYLLCGGDILSPAHINRLLRNFPNIAIINGYGPTENTTFSTTFRVRSQFRDNIPIGYPVANSTAYIVDRFDRLQPVGIAGEILVGGDGLARGYLGDPIKTAAQFIDDPFTPGDKLYRTGDRGRWLPDGAIEFLGRIDQQVKIRGFRIELGEIESVLRNDERLRDAVVIVAAGDAGSKDLVAYVAAAKENDGALDIGEIRRSLARRVPPYMIPSYFVQMESIPLTANGKVDRRALPVPAVSGSDEIFEPQTRTEEKMRTIWAGVLSLPEDSVGVTADFFELGGHSLKGTILTARIHKELDVRVPLTVLFQSPTIRQLSQYVDQAVKQRFQWVEAVEKRDYYLLSAAQRRLYVLQRMDPRSTAYNIPQLFPMPDDTDFSRLRQVFAQLADRHEALRTCFVSLEEETVQRVSQRVDIPVAELDVGLPPSDVFRHFIAPFDMARAPLIRAGLIRRPGEVWLAVDIHHIIGDGTSMDVLIAEFTALYNGGSLPPLRIQYKDYAHWQHSDAVIERIQKEEAYWLEIYSDRPPVLNLPLDFQRPDVQTYEGRVYRFSLGNDRASAIDALAAKTGSTHFMVLLALFYVWLAKLSGQEDIVVGTPVAGRGHADLQPVIGMFVNTLALRIAVDMSMSFSRLLGAVKTRTLEAFDNQDYQFEDLVENVLRSRDVGRNPLFDVMFELGNMGEELAQADGARRQDGDVPEFENTTAKFDLSMAIIRLDGDLQALLTYNVRLFEAGTIQRLSHYFIKLAQKIMAQPDVRLGDIQMTEGLFDGELQVPRFDVEF